MTGRADALTRVAVITGSSRGIGEAIAHELAADGTAVLVHGLEANDVNAVVARLRERGATAHGHPADLTDPGACRAVIDAAVRHYGRIDILVNNAGRNAFTGVLDTSLDAWQACIDLDLRAPWLVARAAVPHMPAGSAIVNLSSNHATRTLPGCFPYNTAKAALNAMTQAMALELAARGIRVNAVCPGYVDTPINDAYFATFPDPARERARVNALHPLGRIGTPRDVARAVRFLALEEESAFITGTTLTVDGGRGALLQDPPAP